MLHFLAVRSFVVEPVAEAQGGFCLADGNFFKEFEGLADAGAAIADGSVVFDVNKGKWMNEACGALAGIGVLGVGLAQEKDYAGVGVVRGFWMRYGVGRRWVQIRLCFFQVLAELSKEVVHCEVAHDDVV